MNAISADLNPANLRPTVEIRPFTENDYEAVVAVERVVWPDYPQTADEWRFRDQSRDPKCRQARFVAEVAGTDTAVGYGSYYQWADMYHPRKFHVNVSVLPEWQNCGIGERLYDQVTDSLKPFDPLVLRAMTRDDQKAAVHFLARRGYVEEMRDWESRLEMAAFDPAAFAQAEARIAGHGITITTLADLQKQEEDWARKLFDLDWTVTLDMPSPDTLTQPTFEHWEKSALQNPNLLPDAWFIALDGDRLVGESALWKEGGGKDLNVGATGVRREYRRRGIALALKLRACAFAKTYGCAQIRTWNAQSNRAMLSINEALGFVKQPAWIAYAKTLKNDPDIPERTEAK
ncbi:MAG: GNAT family N-acetyltransferase [Cytophagales bacterium]|nr:GNAT family N-acetyltransferase [Armatimonadota bacterium]